MREERIAERKADARIFASVFVLLYCLHYLQLQAVQKYKYCRKYLEEQRRAERKADARISVHMRMRHEPKKKRKKVIVF